LTTSAEKGLDRVSRADRKQLENLIPAAGGLVGGIVIDINSPDNVSRIVAATVAGIGALAIIAALRRLQKEAKAADNSGNRTRSVFGLRKRMAVGAAVNGPMNDGAKAAKAAAGVVVDKTKMGPERVGRRPE
jgi:hypothetical protein